MEKEIADVLSSEWIAKVGKYKVRLAFESEKSETVWMSERQLLGILRCFEQTPHDHSTRHTTVIGVWNERGYYAYSKVERQQFIPPVQYRLDDLEDK